MGFQCYDKASVHVSDTVSKEHAVTERINHLRVQPESFLIWARG